MYILTALVAFAGSFVQSSSGFGYAIICMAIWPMFMPFYTASILEAIAAFFMVIYIAVRLWKFIDWKLLLPPVIMATVTSFLGVNTLMALDEDVLSKIMGTVLLILAVYFIFFSSKVHLKASLVSGLAAGAISGFCGGLFNIGGPPMVAYFLSVTDDKEKYNATLQMFFTINTIQYFSDSCISGSCIGIYAAFSWSSTGRNSGWDSRRNVFVSTTYYGRNQKNSIYFYDMCWKLSPFVVSFYGEYEQTAKADGRYSLVNIVKEKGKNLMKHIYLNLKRFDVPVEFGGVNRLAPVADWASCIVKNTQEELKTYDPTEVEFGMYFPEVHLLNAVAAKTEGSPVQIGCQSVFRADTAVGGNFGAFTTNRPASAMVAAGCETTIIGHCEERNDKAGILAEAGVTDTDAVNRLLNQEIKCAIERGMKVLYCIGEKSEEQEQWQEVLGKQLEIGLKDVDTSKVVIAYEPIWSIGPGKTTGR